MKIIPSNKLRDKERETSPFLPFLLYFASLLFFWIATAFCGTVFAQQPDPKSGLIEFYLQAAFANQERVLKRFATKDQFEVNIACLNLSCGEVTRRLKAYLPAPIFNTVSSDKLNQNSDINILILDDKDASKDNDLLNTKIFNILPNDIVVTDGDKQCGGMAIRSKDTLQIKGLAVVTVSSDDPSRDVACLILRIVRGSGLRFADDFPSFWKSQKEISKLNPAEFENRMGILASIIAIHFNKLTKIGMSISDTKSSLGQQSLEQLQGRK